MLSSIRITNNNKSWDNSFEPPRWVEYKTQIAKTENITLIQKETKNVVHIKYKLIIFVKRTDQNTG